MNGRAVLVEFLGLPGVGKSSVSHRVAEILAQKGLPVEQPTYTLDHGPGKLQRTIRKSWWVACEALSHPIYAWRCLRSLRATRQESPRLLFKMIFNWLLVSALVRRSQRSRAIHLFDQGLFQALWSIGLGAGEGAVTRAGRELAPWMPAPTIVAVVEADLATVARRLEGRAGRHSRADAWRESDEQAFRRSSQLLEDVKGLLRGVIAQLRSVQTILVQNNRDADMEINALRLAQSIEQLYLEQAA
jgi:hypothetical protein